jgi:hypothetical protein
MEEVHFSPDREEEDGFQVITEKYLDHIKEEEKRNKLDRVNLILEWDD